MAILCAPLPYCGHNSKEPAMNIYALIKKDHEEARDMMEEILAARDRPRECEELIRELKTAILAHAKSEEKTFYSALKKAADAQLAEEVPHLKKDHKQVEMLFEKIDSLKAGDALWWETFGEIRMGLLHHMEEEEKEIFKEARQEFDAQDAQDMGEEMRELEEKWKQQLEREAA